MTEPVRKPEGPGQERSRRLSLEAILKGMSAGAIVGVSYWGILEMAGEGAGLLNDLLYGIFWGSSGGSIGGAIGGQKWAVILGAIGGAVVAWFCSPSPPRWVA